MATKGKPREPLTLAPHLAGVGVGQAVGHRNLTLVPLTGRRAGNLEYLLAAEAIAAGRLAVTEVSEGGSVPELMVVSACEQMILLVDGEELVGAKQNRILNTSILLPAGAKARIPVSCVEQGRWHHTRPDFQVGGHSPARLRARKNLDVSRNLAACARPASDQGAVWDEVATVLYQTAVPSPTMSLHDVMRERGESIESYVRALPYPDGARGVAVAIDGKFAAADLFDQPRTLGRLWRRLVAGYAMDTLGRGEDKGRPFTGKAVEVLLEHTGELPCRPCPSMGLGEDWRLEAEDVVGQALVVNGISVHLSLFPNLDGRRPETGERGILPPSRRRRVGRATPPGDPGPGTD